jgi:hypothetical protein
MKIARQQLCKYTTLLELLLGSVLPTTMEVLLLAVFSLSLLWGCITRPTELMVVSAVQCKEVKSWLMN